MLIEAALIARNINPGVFRKAFAFEKWPDFNQELFDTIYNDDSQERDFTHHIYGYDVDMKAVNTARLNVKAAGLSQTVTVELQDFKDFKKPAEKSIIMTNPPYGERISTPDLLGTYKMIGERLKHEFGGNEAWILSYREECFEQIGLKPSIKIPLYNGSLECEFRKYALFDGKMKAFRAEGGVVKSEREKREMAQKHRFKKNREFKQHLDDDGEQADNHHSHFKHTKRDVRSEGARKPFRSHKGEDHADVQEQNNQKYKLLGHRYEKRDRKRTKIDQRHGRSNERNNHFQEDE